MGKTKYDHEMEVEFSGVGINKETARLGLRVSRDKIDLDRADELFGNSQLEVQLVCDPNSNGDAPGQTTMKGSAINLKLVCDVDGFRVKPEHVACSLQSNRGAVALDELSRFAFKSGKFKCKKIGAASGKDSGEED